MPHEEHEHPAARAARMIKDLHLQNIALIDDGHVFTKDGENVNEQIRAASVEQVTICDQIIERAPDMSDEHSIQASVLLDQLRKELERKATEQADEPLPEVGDYEHRET